MFLQSPEPVPQPNHAPVEEPPADDVPPLEVPPGNDPAPTPEPLQMVLS